VFVKKYKLIRKCCRRRLIDVLIQRRWKLLKVGFSIQKSFNLDKMIDDIELKQELTELHSNRAF